MEDGLNGTISPIGVKSDRFSLIREAPKPAEQNVQTSRTVRNNSNEAAALQSMLRAKVRARTSSRLHTWVAGVQKRMKHKQNIQQGGDNLDAKERLLDDRKYRSLLRVSAFEDYLFVLKITLKLPTNN